MDHKLLIQQIESILEDETDSIANMANVSSIIKMNMPDLNWVGFYLYKEDQLVLGPFQGNVACTRLYKGKGVCSKAIETNTIQNIPNVDEFPGHVVCDAASKSELVIPLYINNKPYGVLDIDAPVYNRFSQEDQDAFEAIGKLLEQKLS